MQGYCDHRRADAAPVGPADDARRAGRACSWCSGCGSRAGRTWASTGFYFFGLILGILVISQFWTLANEVYDPRQAKRLFGFIGGGASLGGIAGSSPVAAGHGHRHDQPAAGQRGADDRVPGRWSSRSSSARSRSIKGSLTGGEDEGVSSSRGAAAAAQQQAPADHRAHHRVCGHRRRHRRAAAQHGDRGGQGPGQHRLDHQLPRARCSSTRRSSASSSRSGW